MFHSQYEEDRWIANNLKPSPGVFCEVGAFDGILSSNTLFFEQMGWQGILIEPDPYNAALCQKNRAAKTWCCAVGQPRLAEFHVNLNDRGQSGLQRPGRVMPVIVARLDELIRASGFQHVNFLSIDTEGTELEVWETVGDIRPDIVMIEFWTMPEAPRDGAIIHAMARSGYKVAHKTEANLIFVPE